MDAGGARQPNPRGGDTTTAAGKCFLDMLGVFAEFEPTCGGNGSWRGSPTTATRRRIDPARVKQLKSDGLGPTKIARTLRINRASVYRGEIEASASNASR
jgi:DNA invertase Pin-like site-specific DNA recombinase